MSYDTAFELSLSGGSAWVTFFPDFTPVQTDRNMYISKKHSCEQVLSLGKHRKRVKVKINVPIVWMETERETGRDGEWKRERNRWENSLYACQPRLFIGAFWKTLTCAALTLISKFLRASDQADLFILKICWFVCDTYFIQKGLKCFQECIIILHIQ